MSNKLGWLVIASGLALVHCGGKAELESVPSAGGAAAMSSGGTTDAATDCDGSAPEGGCGDDAAASPQADAGLRSACNQSTIVNRSGPSVPICFRIK